MRVIRKMRSDMALTIEPDTVLAYPQSSFHETFSFVLVFGQFFGIMPLHGMSKRKIQDIKFEWKSARLLYAVYNFIGAFVMAVFCILQFALEGLMLDKTGRTTGQSSRRVTVVLQESCPSTPSISSPLCNSS
jgi:hypothetical protein